MSTGIKEAFTALCRKMAEEADPKKLEILKQQMRRLLERESNSTEATRIGRKVDGRPPGR